MTGLNDDTCRTVTLVAGLAAPAGPPCRAAGTCRAQSQQKVGGWGEDRAMQHDAVASVIGAFPFARMRLLCHFPLLDPNGGRLRRDAWRDCTRLLLLCCQLSSTV